MPDQPTEARRTIAKINAMVRGIVEVETLGYFYWVGGKVERYYKSNIGHIYFDLVDDYKSIRCMLPDSQQGHIKFEIKNDIEIEVYGDIQVYEDRADIQIQVIKARLVEAHGISTITGLEQLKQEDFTPKLPNLFQSKYAELELSPARVVVLSATLRQLIKLQVRKLYSLLFNGNM